MSQINLFKWGNICQCAETIKKTGNACAVCRIEQMMDYNYVSNMLEMLDDPYEVSIEDETDSD